MEKLNEKIYVKSLWDFNEFVDGDVYVAELIDDTDLIYRLENGLMLNHFTIYEMFDKISKEDYFECKKESVEIIYNHQNGSVRSFIRM